MDRTWKQDQELEEENRKAEEEQEGDYSKEMRALAEDEDENSINLCQLMGLSSSDEEGNNDAENPSHAESEPTTTKKNIKSSSIIKEATDKKSIASDKKSIK